MYSNCLFFALKLYHRRRRKGRKGRVISRQSPYYIGPHFLYQRYRKDGTTQVVSYVPIKYRKGWNIFAPLIFKGRVKWGDDPNLL